MTPLGNSTTDRELTPPENAGPLSDPAIVSEAITRAEREPFDAGLVPAQTGSGELPSQAATETVQSKAVSGAKSLGVRTVVSLVLRALSSLTLSRFLFPANYGIFNAASGIAGLGQYFCDVGMGSVLVTQEREPTDDEVTTVFWLQQALTTVVVVVILACIPLLLKVYKAPASATPFLIVMAVGLFPAALRVVPVMRLERSLNFGLQAKAEMVENFAQVGVNLLLASLHFGTWALVGGAITARIVGLIAIYNVSPWRPRGRFRMDLAKRFVGRGTQFQINILAPILIGSLFPIIISRSLGLEALGFVGWAANLATVPLMLSGILNRIAFPSLSRLQSNPSEMGRVTCVLIRRVSVPLSVAFAPVMLFSPFFLPLIFDPKWSPAVPLFQWSILDSINIIMVGLLAQTLSAAGFLTARLIGAILGGCVKIALLYIAIRLFGLTGAGVGAYFGTIVELAVLVFYTRKHIEGSGSLFKDVLSPLIGVQGVAATGLIVAQVAFGATRGANLPSFVSAATATVVFGVGLLLYNFAAKTRPITTECLGLLRLIKAR